jgi:uncharacterized repeat protein (TIGR03806 family)
MKNFHPRFTGVCILLLCALNQIVWAAPLERVANTTLTNLPAQPPQFGYTLVNAFPGVSLTQPVCIASPPGETNRLFILEKTGNMIVITNLAAPTRTVFMSLPAVRSDSESGLIGLAFHPNYSSNGFFYIFATTNQVTALGSGRHQRISRYSVSPSNPNQGLASSQLTLINQRDGPGNHNGGDLHFGLDGYLYATVGDEGQQYNGGRHAQIITNHFFSAVLRIDVDKRPGNLLPNPHPASTTNYFVPADNPYVGVTNFNGQNFAATNVRTEFYAIGFRNPWRMSFDPATGRIYLGDVGQDRYEEVDIITKGGNYGWAYYEGDHLASALYPGNPTILLNPPPGLTFPIQEYAHSGNANFIGNSVIGGVVYRGTRISQLYGAYIFADNGSAGNVWMLRHDGSNTVPFQRLLSASGPTSFGVDPRNGDVLIAQFNGQIVRLQYNASPVGQPLPPTLADTGGFSDLATLTPNAGIVPYDLNLPFWSDNAIKRRWFSLPNTNFAIGFNPTNNWFFPTGSVWIKHFDLELTNGAPDSRKRLETRFIVRNTNGVYGVTYRWNSETNATLVPEAGLDETFAINDGGTLRTQVWHYPSRSECLACHTPQGGLALGFNTAQLNRDFDYGGTITNQLEALSQAGYFTNAIANRHLLRALVTPTNHAASLESRVRSYLAANCVQCHQPGGPSTATWDARLFTTTANAGLIHGTLVNNGGDASNRVIVPGSLTNSMLLTRISKRGPGQMPPIASTLVDTQAVALVSAWITNDLPGYQTFADWQILYFASTNSPDAAAFADIDGDAAKNYLEYLTGTIPTNALDAWNISIGLDGMSANVIFPQIANRGFEVQASTNLMNFNSWTPLNVPANAPFFSSSNQTAVVPALALPETPNFYRVRVFEP